jgi:drug/metabolite transporter (DMT)-like permease
LRTQRPIVQVIRAGVTVGYAWVLVWSFAALSFADATAISYTYALYIVLLAPWLLGEAAGARRWLAVGIGAIGAVLIIRPSAGVSLVYVAVLVLTSLNALAVILNRWLQQRGESPATVLLYVHLAMLAMFLPGAVERWPLAVWPWLLIACVTGPLGMLAGIVAVRYAETTLLAPWTYLRLLLAMAGGAVVFGEAPDVASVAGAAAIVLACVMASKPQSRNPR